MRVLFHVQHLLGVGHLRRGELLARAMAARGMEVTVALGGMPVREMPFAGANVVQLPPTHIEGADFTVLFDEAGDPITDEWRAERRDSLLSLYDEIRPDIVLLEMFPFGRWRFRFELVPLLQRANADRPRVRCVASVRDILVATKHPERAAVGAAIAREHLDAVLVHSDPSLFSFGETYPHAGEVEDLLRYTGYVTEPAERGPAADNGEVVVSAGGGAAAGILMRTALAARELAPRSVRERRWRLLTGPRFPQPEFDALAAQAGDRLVVERFAPDFQSLLDGAALSISQAGYNTIMNLLRARVPAVVVPYDEGDETEQAFRSERLRDKGLLSVVPASRLTPETLAQAIGESLASPSPTAPAIDLDGAAASARILEELVS